MALTEQNGISIAEIIYYVPAGAIGVFLAVRHGFGRNAGWLYLVILSLMRIVGASLELATISQPKNTGLYIGAGTLQSVGLSPLVLVTVALVNRLLAGIKRTNGKAILDPRILRLVQIVVVVGLILSIRGGTDAGSDFADTGMYKTNTLIHIGVALTIVAYVLLVLATLITAANYGSVEDGEKRLLIAVGLSLPFILVRIAYSAETAYGTNPDFNTLTGNPSITLGMAIIMEMIVVAIVESFGLTLKKVPKEQSKGPLGRLFRSGGRSGGRYSPGHSAPGYTSQA
ncbi:hypothetical protein GGR56DRAFT_648839 [Xylariaceae sp. FL0804]|nr:hypothetical protein GGR56DRAFT_648839 [Xylariaceae sp. FL0804]